LDFGHFRRSRTIDCNARNLWHGHFDSQFVTGGVVVFHPDDQLIALISQFDRGNDIVVARYFKIALRALANNQIVCAIGLNLSEGFDLFADRNGSCGQVSGTLNPGMEYLAAGSRNCSNADE
jgi:hypothetical protein